MDRLSRAWYQREAELALRKKQGNEFQDFFSLLMELSHPCDFQRVRAYGNQGDLKCDGYLANSDTVFQVYAPRTTKLAELLRKISDDFSGAMHNWPGRLQSWVFVHNDWDGLPAVALQLLLEIQRENPAVHVETWGPQAMLTRIHQLPEEAIERLLDPAPTLPVFDALGFDRLRPVLINIRRHAPPAQTTIRPVSPEKLSANAFSPPVIELLRLGRQKEALVAALLGGWPEPDFGEELAEAFRRRYAEARDCGLSADEIFGELQGFAGGSMIATDPAHQAATLAVLSYFFERCDIFEDHPEAAP